MKILFHHIFHHLKAQTGTKKIFALPLNEKEKFPESTGNKALSGNFSLAAGEGFEPSQTESESVVLPLHNPAKFCFLRPATHERRTYYSKEAEIVKGFSKIF